MRSISKSLLALGLLAASAAASAPALACGGFFCNQSQPVNQAAERIVFADNGDGSVTAVIQIMYQGPSKNFSWLLPLSSVPQGDDLAVASDLAFTRLQQATNPNYTLTTTIEGTCNTDNSRAVPGAAVGAPQATGNGSGGSAAIDPGVKVEASGVVGAFDWTVISVDPKLPAPADAAVNWLKDNGYDVPSGAPSLLSPYLDDGMYLLALRLVKGADSGSIRPIVLTYDAKKPMIPVKLTAVAANDDMGVMAWLLGSSRAVPLNYYALELNEARINWFNASSNYNQVVSAAADDGGGQGFVTEFAGDSSGLANRVWSDAEEMQWTLTRDGVYPDFSTLFDRIYAYYGSYDGFWDAVRATVTFTADGPTFDDFKLCPNCYQGKFSFSPSELMKALEAQVIEPMRVIQKLIDAHPKLTRLYTTMSAEEMTVDPLFGFNPDLADVSNLHTAKRIIECSSEYTQFDAPWRIELPQGGTIRGKGSPSNVWPSGLDSQPPNLSVSRLSESGSGRVVEDNAADILLQLDAYNTTGSSVTSGGGGSTSGGAAAGGGKATGGPTTTGATAAGGAASSGPSTPTNAAAPSGDSGCSVASTRPATGYGFLALSAAGLWLVARRRRGAFSVI
jgi:hypothetical protein